MLLSNEQRQHFQSNLFSLRVYLNVFNMQHSITSTTKRKLSVIIIEKRVNSVLYKSKKKRKPVLY